MNKRESKFIEELHEAFNVFYPEIGNFFHKIKDLPQKKQCKKPYDIVISHRHVYYGVEAKVHTTSTAWRLNNVEVHQLASLMKVSPNGFILLNVSFEETNFIRVFSALEFEQIQTNLLKKGRHSLIVEDIYNGFIINQVPMGNKMIWDIRSLFHWKVIKNCG